MSTTMITLGARPSITIDPVTGVIVAKPVDGASVYAGSAAISAGAAADSADAAAASAAELAASMALVTAFDARVDVVEASNTALDSRLDAVEIGQSAAVVGFDTQANLYANLNYADKTVAYVTNDSTSSKNGTYRKSGASGSGSWVQSSYDRVALVETRATNLEADKTVTVAGGKNLFNVGDIVPEYGVNYLTGAIVSFAGYTSSGFIPVDYAINTNVRTTVIRYVAQYDVNKAFIAASGQNVSPASAQTIALNASAKFIRITVANAALAATQVEYGTTNTAFEAYKPLIKNLFKQDSYVYKAMVPDDTTAANVARIDATAILPDANNKIRRGQIPYVTFANSLGSSEMMGDGEYLISYLGGFYETMIEETTFNAIRGVVWCTDQTTNIEWKLFIRPSTTVFNLSTTTPDDSGTILAGSFPATATEQTFALNKTLIATTGKVVLLMFRAVNDSKIYIRKWAYNAGISRSGILISVSAPGWVTSGWGYGAYGSGYGKTAAKFLLQNEELIPVQASLNSIVPVVPVSTAFDIVLPPSIYAVEGHEMNVYLDNLTISSLGTYFDVACTVGTQQNERWTYIPAAAVSTTLSISAINISGEQVLDTATATLTAKLASVGNGISRSLLIIGDSTTANGEYTGEMLNLFNSDVMDITLLGTKGTGLNKHEGIAGWKISDFYTSVTSPFVFSGSFNFAQYLSTNSLTTPYYVCIHLGINDVGNYTSDAATQAAMTTMVSQLEAMITNIMATGVARIGMMVTIPPSATQDAFGNNYGSGLNRNRMRRNILLWARKMIDTFGGRTGSGIYLIPINCNLDTVNNMSFGASAPVNSRSTINVIRQNNGVHPATPGYYQMADTMFAFLKCQET